MPDRVTAVLDLTPRPSRAAVSRLPVSTRPVPMPSALCVGAASDPGLLSGPDLPGSSASSVGASPVRAVQPMISLRGVNKSYRSGNAALHVLANVDLTVAEGELVSIMGSSGSGKSTLLNILGLLDDYDSGTYHLADTLIQNLGERRAAQYRNRLIGFVFQSFNLLAFKSALENVALPLYYQGVPRKERNRIALDYLRMMDLEDRAHHLPSELSGGQKQRVAIARALIAKPKLILADEPTGALDSATSYQLMDLLRSINAQGITMVIVTHEPDIAERTDRVIVLRDGRVHREDP
jgi:putative ABC transport system ATP-binding protein